MKTRDGHEITEGMRLYAYLSGRAVTVDSVFPDMPGLGDMIRVTTSRDRRGHALLSLEYSSVYVADPANTQRSERASRTDQKY